MSLIEKKEKSRTHTLSLLYPRDKYKSLRERTNGRWTIKKVQMEQ